MPNPAQFFSEAERAVRKGGRLIMCEPFVSLLSYRVYRVLHEEGLDSSVDPFTQNLDPGKDPFAGNQAIPTAIFQQRRQEVEQRFLNLRILSVKRMAGLAYPAFGGFNRRALLPQVLWNALDRVESLLPKVFFRWAGFRMLVVLGKVSRPLPC